jgi:hypothetical protein
MTEMLHLGPRAARAIAAASLDTYEAAVRAISDLERAMARAVAYEPLSSVAGGLADLTRDAGAIQLSTIRWMLDL